MVVNGKLKNTLDEAGEEQYLAYDFKGNLLQKQRRVIKDALLSGTSKFEINWDTGVPNNHLGTQIFETTTDYDALSRIQKITLPDDTEKERKEIKPHYNRAGALERVELDEEEYVKEIAYNAKGQRLLISFGNGVMNRYTYDPQNFRLLRMKAEKYTFSETATERTYSYNSGTNRQDLGYEYDLNGNILKKKNRTPDCGISGTTLGVDALDNDYSYDAISRLLNATGRESDANNESYRWADAPKAGSPNASNTQTYTRQYGYDKVGNIEALQQTGNNPFTRTFNYTDNTLDDITISGTPTSFTYDTNGNLITSGSSRFYEWNEKDQLSFFKVQAGGTPSVSAHYLYDGGGNRVKKIVWDQQGNKEVTVYIDGVFEYRLKQEDSTDKEQNVVHVMDDSARIAQVRIGTAFNNDIAETVHYVLDDHLGSSNARLNSTGGIIDRQEYYPFGDTSLRTYSSKKYQFIGREKDAESGLHYWSARYYSSWMCRFISVDKMASSYAQLSPYNYSDNDPINDFDIDGNQNNNTNQTNGDTNNKPNSGGAIEDLHQVLSSLKDKINLINFKSFNFEKLPAMESKMEPLELIDTSSIVEEKNNIKPKSGNSRTEWHPPLTAPSVENVEAVVDYSFENLIKGLNGNSESNGEARVKYTQSLISKNYVYGQDRPGGKLNFEDVKMDCSECIAYVLQKTDPKIAKLFTVNGNINTSTINKAIDESGIPLRKTNPKVGDIAIWTKHVEFVETVDGKNFTTIGARGKAGSAVPTSMGVKNGYNWLNTDYNVSSLGGGTFRGFWTPPNK